MFVLFHASLLGYSSGSFQQMENETESDFILIIILLERFSNDCRKTKTKAIAPTNHNRSRQRDEPIKIPSNCM